MCFKYRLLLLLILFVFTVFFNETLAKDSTPPNLLGADWIMSPDINSDMMPRFRKAFDIYKEVKSATLYSSALGIYDIFINGQRVGEVQPDGSVVYDELKPGWTDYRTSVMYQTYDITAFVKSGKNIIGALVSSGWWHSWIAWGIYGEAPMCLLASVKVEYVDGSIDVVNTDTTWTSDMKGPITNGDLWHGEIYDARLSDEWLLPEYDDSKWLGSVVYTYSGMLKPQVGGAIRILTDKIRPVEQTTLYETTEVNGTDFGMITPIFVQQGFEPVTLQHFQKLILDFGQNMAGVVGMTLKGKMGTKITIRHAEMLNDNGSKERGNDGPGGSIYRANLRTAKAETNYILAGESIETYIPTTTYFGFRYCEISTDGEVSIENVQAYPLSSSYIRTGEIETSNESINKLFSNIQWGQYSNFMSIPTDCPQRDERWGWLGDAQVFSRTAMYNSYLKDFYHKYLEDIRESQREDGAYPDVAPWTYGRRFGNAGWADAGIIIPWNLYLMYGDKDILEQHYESMEKYMDYLSSQHTDEIVYSGGGVEYGDWLAYDKCDNRYLAMAYYAYDAYLMMKISKCLSGAAEDLYAIKSILYSKLFNNIKDEYQKKYWNPMPVETTQTTYLLPLAFGLLSPEQVEYAKNALKDAIVKNDGLLSTGFLGTSLLMQTLSKYGLDDEAYSLILQRGNPSWLYSVDQGATTIWERWDSYTNEKGFAPDGMNSFNHYAYGAIGEWMYRYMLGIDTDEYNPGFNHIILSPHPDRRENIPKDQERLRTVEGAYYSSNGEISVRYELNESLNLNYTCSIPYNATATLTLPLNKIDNIITIEGKPAEEVDGIELIAKDDRKVTYFLNSGIYKFQENEQETSGILKTADSYQKPYETELYNIRGERITHPQSGVYLKRTISGNSKYTQKCMKK